MNRFNQKLRVRDGKINQMRLILTTKMFNSIICRWYQINLEVHWNRKGKKMPAITLGLLKIDISCGFINVHPISCREKKCVQYCCKISYCLLCDQFRAMFITLSMQRNNALTIRNVKWTTIILSPNQNKKKSSW